ncbi:MULTISPECIES: hypothetical protein [unclassified Microcoleus]|uniref:hypothetical protein n=1 Tax=unclassified Microcoleus TaxID=2642155 RepID=UPI002FD4735F
MKIILNLSGGTYTVTVSETNTTKSAYGGQFVLYDVHIAKMFEVTYSDCQEIPNAGGRTWYYRARNSKIDMGQFRINCQLASDIANTYGLGNQSVLRVAIFSLSNILAEIHDKLVEYFENGARLVWVIHAKEQ